MPYLLFTAVASCLNSSSPIAVSRSCRFSSFPLWITVWSRAPVFPVKLQLRLRRAVCDSYESKLEAYSKEKDRGGRIFTLRDLKWNENAMLTESNFWEFTNWESCNFGLERLREENRNWTWKDRSSSSPFLYLSRLPFVPVPESSISERRFPKTFPATLMLRSCWVVLISERL